MPNRFNTLLLIFVLFVLSIPVLSFAEETGKMKRYHLSGGITGALYPMLYNKETYLGYFVSPEVKLSYSLKEDDDWRGFLSFIWQGAEKFTKGDSIKKSDTIKPRKADGEEWIVALGLNTKIFGDDTNSKLSTPLNRVYIAVGYGNLLSETEGFLKGPMILIGLELSAISFNF